MTNLFKSKSFYISILVFILFFISSFILCYVLAPVNCDEVWTFGFSNNIAKGLVIYRDFNVLQTPFYFIIASFFIKVFGTKFISIHILNSLLMASSGLILYKLVNWKSFMIMLSIMIFNPNPYNLLCLCLFLVIILLINKKYDNDYLIALLVGLIFMTKQNLILLVIPLLLYSNKKIKTLLVFLIPFIIFSLYFLINNGLYDFINYCFLGLFDFNNSNHLYVFVFILFEIMGILYVLYCIYKKGFRDKELLYILMFQIMIYPIFDGDHFFVSFVPIFYLISKNIKNYLPLLLIYVFVICITIAGFPKISIHTEKDIFYLRSPDRYVDISEDVYKYFDGKIDNVYSNSEIMYFTKNYYDLTTDKYDFIIDGNLGYKGSKKVIKELDKKCKVNNCYFIIKNDDLYQDKALLKYVKSNYKVIDRFSYFDVYN